MLSGRAHACTMHTSSTAAYADLLNASATPTEHDTNITSVSLDQGAPRHLRKVLRGELDLDLLEDWFSELLQAQGSDIFRMKGVLAIAHAPQRYVYHAVHMTFDSYFDEEWSEGEARESKLVFIGKNLDAEVRGRAWSCAWSCGRPQALATAAALAHL